MPTCCVHGQKCADVIVDQSTVKYLEELEGQAREDVRLSNTLRDMAAYSSPDVRPPHQLCTCLHVCRSLLPAVRCASLVQLPCPWGRGDEPVPVFRRLPS